MPSSRLDSHRNSVQNGMVEKFTAFMATVFVPNFRFYVTATFCRPRFPKASSSQKRSRRNSVQNAPVGIFTALLGTTFVNISVFMSRGNFRATFGQPARTSCTCSNLRFESLSLRFETFRFSEPPCARFEPHCEASRFEVEPLNLTRFETLVHYTHGPFFDPMLGLCWELFSELFSLLR